MSDQIPEDKLNLYKQLINSHPELELKGGKKLSYTSLNGNMFTQITKEGKVGLRLGKVDYDAFIADFNAQPLRSYGAVMREYVEVPDEMLADLDTLKPYLQLSYDYAQTLKPKPTKKKK